MKIQACLTAAVINLKRLAAALVALLWTIQTARADGKRRLRTHRARTGRSRAVELKTPFRQIDADDVDLFHGFPSCRAVSDAILPQFDTAGRARPPHCGRDAGYPAPPAQIRTCPLRHPAPPSGLAPA